jgi:hypothetical protein
MAAETGFLAGNFHGWVAIVDSDGYPMGTLQTPDSPVNGTVYNPLKIELSSNTTPTPTIDIAQFRHGQSIIGQRALGTSDFGTFQIELAAYNEDFNRLIGGSAVDEATASGLNITAPNTGNADLPQLMLGIAYGYQLDSGTNKHLTVIYTNVQISPVIPSVGQEGGVNPGALTYDVTPSQATRTPAGLLFSATSLAVQDNKDVSIAFNYADPITIATWSDDGSATTITVAYRPTSGAVDGSINIFTDEGVEDSANVSAFSTTTGATTHTAADAGDRRVILYPTNFVAP